MNRLDTIWHLPGPRSFVQEVLRAASMQHVMAVLPVYLIGNADVADALAEEVIVQGDDARRLRPWSANGNLIESVGFELVDGDDTPVTVPDLLHHPELAGKVFVMSTTDLDEPHTRELPEFVRRLEVDSRTTTAADRCTFVVVTGRVQLPLLTGGERAGVAVANVWYWNRVARWDVAAHLAVAHYEASASVAAEIRIETILEVARWDFGIAIQLLESWDGDYRALDRVLGETGTVSEGQRLTRSPSPTRPPEALLDAWDAGSVERWHGSLTWAPRLDLAQAAVANRLAWSAQARVLLPWIEVRRSRLEQALVKRLGEARLADALQYFAREGHRSGDVVEIGLLHRMTAARVGKSDPGLTEASRQLWLARNRLAHLEPLAPGAVEALVLSCDIL